MINFADLYQALEELAKESPHSYDRAKKCLLDLGGILSATNSEVAADFGRFLEILPGNQAENVKCQKRRCEGTGKIEYRKSYSLDESRFQSIKSESSSSTKKLISRVCIFPSCKANAGYAGSLYCEYHFREERANSK